MAISSTHLYARRKHSGRVLRVIERGRRYALVDHLVAYSLFQAENDEDKLNQMTRTSGHVYSRQLNDRIENMTFTRE